MTPEVDNQSLAGLFALEGRVALVTGARQGIGAAIAAGLARAGATVAVTSRDIAEVEPLAAELEDLGGEAMALELELGDVGGVEEAVESIVGRVGRIDIVVNNAGLSIRGDSLAYPVDAWDRVMETNARGTFLVSRAAARHMRDRGSGRIVNLSSPFARLGLPSRAAYSASKAAIEQLTRSLAVEWAPAGITVNAVAPTTVITESRRELFSDAAAVERRVSRIPLSRLAKPDDVVGAVLLLAGEGGGMITGQTIVVDGGYSIAGA